MKIKKMNLRLELNKVTICKLDNLGMQIALAGNCPPPTSPGGDESCDFENGCSNVECDPDAGISTAPC